MCFLGIYGLFFGACIDPINLSLPGDREYLVINGQVTNLSEPYVVSIKRSSDFSSEPSPKESKVSGAKVYVIGQDQSMGIFKEDNQGFYVSDTSQFVGKLGNSYKLFVELNDKTCYESSWETIHPVQEIGDVHFEVKTKTILNELENIVHEKKVQVSTDVEFPITSNQIFLIWDLEGEFEFNEQEQLRPGETNETCYIKDNLLLGARTIFDASSENKNKMSKQVLIELDKNYKLSSAYCIHIKQQSISANAFAFWAAAKELNEKDGSLLDKLPGRVRSNLRNSKNPDEQVFGFFYASSVHQKRVFVPNEIIMSQPAPCPSTEPIFAGFCHDCLQIKNSTYTKPDYWIK